MIWSVDPCACEPPCSKFRASCFWKSSASVVVATTTEADDFQKQEALALLQGGSQAQGSTDQIIGMLKAMLEEMEGDLKSAQDSEAAAAAGFEELSAAKTSEIEAAA